MTKIIIDSTCDIPKEMIERFDIAVLPLSVTIDEKVYRDGTEIHLDDVYKAMRNGKTPKTSQIRWDDTEALFTSIAEKGDDFIYLAFSSAMSGTFNLAKLVCKELRAKYPSRRMEVVDSKGGSMGAGLIAVQLGLMKEHGVPFSKMLSHCSQMTAHVKYVFTIDDLKYAMQGGRLLARTVGSLGSVLNIKPLMGVKNGMLHLDKIVRGSKQSLEAIANKIINYAGRFDEQLIGITHANDTKKASALKKLLQERLPKCTFLCQPIGSVLGAHLGLGGVGVFCMDRRPATYYNL